MAWTSAAPTSTAAAPAAPSEEITPEDVQTDLRGAVRVGLGYVKAVGEVGAMRIEEERLRAGPYRSLFDFTQRTGLSREASTNLIQVGAFDDLGLNRRELI